MSKVVIAGGSGQVGQILARHYTKKGDDVVILCRSASVASTRGSPTPHREFGSRRFALRASGRVVSWDAKTAGAWADEVDGADVVINLAGRSVNCRYTKENMAAMLDSRVDSTRAVGEAIAKAKSPPRVWLQMSTATIYAHRFDAPNDEATGIIGGEEPDVPAYWAFSVKIAKDWEAAQEAVDTPKTRKVALRTSMVMSPDKEGIFDVLLGLVRKGLGGTAGSGKQYVSWIHDEDFIRAIDFLLAHEELSGAVNMASPGPLPYKEFMTDLRAAWGTRIGLPATSWMLEIGAWVMRTDTELVQKSRRVIPGRLTAAGFDFHFPEWSAASADLVKRVRSRSE